MLRRGMLGGRRALPDLAALAVGVTTPNRLYKRAAHNKHHHSLPYFYSVHFSLLIRARQAPFSKDTQNCQPKQEALSFLSLFKIQL